MLVEFGHPGGWPLDHGSREGLLGRLFSRIEIAHHKDFWARLSISQNPVRFTYGGSHEIHVADLRRYQSLGEVQ
jgi:hypothetical protein